MMRKIYNIMEYHTINDMWPEHQEFLLSANTFLVLTLTDDGNKRAYIQSPLDSIENMVLDMRSIIFDIPVPDDFPLRYFVNMYRLTREYGGPEEGGWYWDCMGVENSQLCLNKEHAEKLHKDWDSNIDHEAQDKEPYYKVNSEGHLICVIENHAPMDPVRPTYE